MTRHTRIAAIGLAALMLVLSGGPAPPSAWADPGHATHAGQPVVVTQAVGPTVLRARITPPGNGSGTVVVDVDAPERPAAAAELTVAAGPAGAGTGANIGRAAIAVDDPGPYSFRFPVAAAGPWELRLVTTGPAGRGQATVPFAVVATPASALEVALWVALAVVAGLVLVLVVLVVRTAPGRNRWPVLAAGVGAVIAGLAVVVTLGVQYVLVPAAQRVPPTPGDQSATGEIGTRPPAELVLRARQAVAGTTGPLVFDLVDGYTGRPVDDLVPHHEALVHLVVVRDGGGSGAGSFAHLHPARVAPGRFVADVGWGASGSYTAYVEITRRSAGAQLLHAGVTVGGPARQLADSPKLVGTHRLASGLSVEATTGGRTPTVGRATTLRFRVARHGRPVDRLDPWLGMPGHLLGRSSDGAVFAHVHAAGAMTPTGQQTSRPVPGPDMSFTYTFPRPGRYMVWLQFLHDRVVRTVSGVLDVQAEAVLVP